MKRVINFVKGKKDDRKDKVVTSNICVEITNPLGQKVPSEDEHIVGLQMGYGYDLDLSGRDRSMTKLHKAAWQGNLDKVKLHLKKFDINVTDEYNRTPLHLAAAQGHAHVVYFLLDNKAAPDICDSDGMTPFLKAVECGIRECVSVLIEKGVQMSTTDNNGNTALHITARQGFFNIMSMLLKQGPNCDCANNAGEMPLHIATEQEHRDLVELLLQAKAHVNVVDRDNRTPLMLAARVGQASIVTLLLKYGASLDACDNNGWTAEDYAMIGGNEQLALELRVPQDTSGQLVSESEQTLELEETDEPIDNNNVNTPQEIIIKDPNDNETSLESIKNDDNSEDRVKPTIKSPPYSVLAAEDEAQESPRSCITPPPLNPPRSWEMIQAGMIDQTQVRRRSLMALGTLESHRESFIENGNSHEASDLNFPPSPPINLEVCDAKVDSDTEWDSEDSLPLDRSLPLPPPPDSLPLPPDSLPLPPDSLTPDCSLPPVPELIITPDRRSRITLERTPSLDLTDSEIVESFKVSADETLGKEGTLKGVEETWEAHIALKTNIYVNNNSIKDDHLLSVHDTGQPKTSQVKIGDNDNDIKINTFQIELKENNGGFRESYSLENLDDCGSKCSEIESSQSCERLEIESSQSCERLESGVHSSNLESSINEIDFTQSLDSLEEESLMGTVVKRNTFLESHSLELLEEPKRPLRHHSRNKSMSATSSFNWSRSVDVLSKPTNTEAQSLDSKRIDAQLMCYDEALRELAEEQKIKEDLLIKAFESNPFTTFNLNQSASCDEIEPRTSANQRRSTSSNQISSGQGQQESESLDKANSSREGYKQAKKANTIDTFVPQFSVMDKKERHMSNEVSVSKLTTVKQQSTQFDANKMGKVPIDSFASSSTFSSCKSKTNKQRSSSVSSRDKKSAGESKLKFYNSLELPPRPKKGKDKVPQTNSSNKYSSYVAENHAVKTVKLNSAESEQINPKAPPRVRKALKKEKSDGDIGTNLEAKGAVRKGIARSASMFTERTKGIDPNKLVISNDNLCEKSDTDSEWSDRPLKSKRKQFVAMRGVAADSDSNEEDPPFWLSTGKEGCFSRQDTVIYNHNANGIKKNSDGGKLGEEGNEEGSSSSETASVSLSHSEDSPSQIFPFKGHQSLLKEHLKQATDEKGRLEELTAKLREQTERLQYDIADAHQSIVARDDKMIILQDELSRLSSKYSSSLDEMNSLKQSLITAEIELNHLREITRMNLEKENNKPELNSQHIVRQLQEANKCRKRLEFEKETLIAQHIMDIEKLQQDTIHWKNLYEDAVSKLEQIEALYDPCLMENNQHLDKVKSFFKTFRDEKSRQCKLKSSSSTDSNLIENRSPNIDRSKEKNDSKSDCFKESVVDNQVATLKLQLHQEKTRSCALETQVQKMLLDLQKKIDLEMELENLNHRLKKDFVPKVELDQLRANQETVIGRIRQQALLESETKLNVKLAEINQILQLQLQEQSQKERQRELAEAQMKQEFENTRQKLLIELSRVQAALKAKESEERLLREQCESMAREAEKRQDMKRNELIRRSYSVNLVDPYTTREKELTPKLSVIPPPPPPPPIAPPPLDVNMFTAHSLRQQLERTLSKHRDIQLSLVGEDLPSPPGRSQH